MIKGRMAEAKDPSYDRLSALQSALRLAPTKERSRGRASLKAAVLKLLPDLLACRAKGYSSADLAAFMRDNGFAIAPTTLQKYLADACAPSRKRRKKRAAKATSGSKKTKRDSPSSTVDAAKPPSARRALLTTKPPARNGGTARDVLGHRFDYDV